MARTSKLQQVRHLRKDSKAHQVDVRLNHANVTRAVGLGLAGAYVGRKLLGDGGEFLGGGLGLLTGAALDVPPRPMPSVDEIIGTQNVNGLEVSPVMAEVLRERRGQAPVANDPNTAFALNPTPVRTSGTIDLVSAERLSRMAEAQSIDEALAQVSQLDVLKDLARSAGGELTLFSHVDQFRAPLLVAHRGGHFADVSELVLKPSGELRIRVTGQRAAQAGSLWGLGQPEVTLNRRISTDWFRPLAWTGQDLVDRDFPLTPKALVESLESLLKTGLPTVVRTESRPGNPVG